VSTEIYYFSGAGNSFYVAKELQKRIIDSKLIPIVSLLKQKIIEVHGETVGKDWKNILKQAYFWAIF